MNYKLHSLSILVAIFAGIQQAGAQGTAFTYQGQLSAGGGPANGFYDFEFSLYNNAAGSGNPVGGPVTALALGVTNGLFTTSLNFGPVFSGNSTWLAISVCSNGVGSYTALTPLQELNPAPYAIFANTAGNVSGSVPSAQLSGAFPSQLTGTIPLAQLPAAVVTNNETSVTLSNVTLSGNLYLPTTPTWPVSVGIIYAGGSPLIYVGLYGGNGDFFAGPGAGNTNATGWPNLGVGSMALNSLTSGADNTALGPSALQSNQGGSGNTAAGQDALERNTGGSENTAAGLNALGFNSSGSYNTANGYYALSGNDTGYFNTADGAHALHSSSIGSSNTASGAYALFSSTTGSNNIALGFAAGYNITTGNSNIDIGNPGLAADTNLIRIGAGQTQAYIAGIITGNGGGLTNLSASQLSGTLSLSSLPGSPTFSGAVTATGFAGNGANVTNVNAAALDGLNGTNYWQLGGNNAGAGQFLGSTNNQPVELWANGLRALRLEPGGVSSNAILFDGFSGQNGAPNVIGGAPVNTVAPGVVGAVIGGGGAANWEGDGNSINSIGGYSDFSTIGGGKVNVIQTNSYESTIGGGFGNSIQANAYHSTISGGYYNIIETNSDDSFVGGGYQNGIWINSSFSAIAGGQENSIGTNAVGSTIGGGYFNIIQNNSSSATIAGGYNNIASGSSSVIAGGVENQAGGIDSVIGGGVENQAGGDGSFIGGGGWDDNTLSPNIAGSPGSVIGGGVGNQAGGADSVIGGGIGNNILVNGASIGGGQQNTVQTGADHSVVGGGWLNTIGHNDYEGTIAGGYVNGLLPSAPYSTIGGGEYNTNGGAGGTISGGQNNTITSGLFQPALGGGYGNTASASYATISGGFGNVASGPGAFIGGGGADGTYYGSLWVSNVASGAASVIGGGFGNTNNGDGATIGGGYYNLASLEYATIGGGLYNVASGEYSTVPGGYYNLALGDFSFACGAGAIAQARNTFVWADGEAGSFLSGGEPNTFNVRATGGVWLWTAANGSGVGTAGAELKPGDTTWTALSDRNAKKNFQAVDTRAVLEKLAAIPIQTWNYKWEEDSAVPNIGPMAQDFKAAFFPGRDDKGINTLEFDGVELAAIQGLNQKLNEKDAEIQDLKQSVAELKMMVQSLAGKK